MGEQKKAIDQQAQTIEAREAARRVDEARIAELERQLAKFD